jgi:hypothetical protein
MAKREPIASAEEMVERARLKMKNPQIDELKQLCTFVAPSPHAKAGVPGKLKGSKKMMHSLHELEEKARKFNQTWGALEKSPRASRALQSSSPASSQNLKDLH